MISTKSFKSLALGWLLLVLFSCKKKEEEPAATGSFPVPQISAPGDADGVFAAIKSSASLPMPSIGGIGRGDADFSVDMGAGVDLKL